MSKLSGRPSRNIIKDFYETAQVLADRAEEEGRDCEARYRRIDANTYAMLLGLPQVYKVI
jgi:hypothetical protein